MRSARGRLRARPFSFQIVASRKSSQREIEAVPSAFQTSNAGAIRLLMILGEDASSNQRVRGRAARSARDGN